MKTPICDFVKEYAERDISRFHMPGHKGKKILGIEPYDITEIVGADTLYDANGIIAESEDNATRLFGTAHTFYSAEGSTLAIRAMLAIALCDAPKNMGRPVILAARGAHKSFVYSCALLDIDVRWIYPESREHLCAASVTKESVLKALSEGDKPFAVYITSPDYLGNITDVSGISEVCKQNGILLLVDNAHGAYLNFLTPAQHPIALGAHMCCDSAHKTLPVLTGGAYLHISKSANPEYVDLARRKLAIFASTSPSYLILQSLDLCNAYLAEGYKKRLEDTVRKISAIKKKLCEAGIAVSSSEPLKIVLHTVKFGYTGGEISDYLRAHSIEVEFFDGEYAVLMATPENRELDFERLENALLSIKVKREIKADRDFMPKSFGDRCMSIREAVFSPSETVRVSDSVGRICASVSVSCPPAVPIVISGERITEEDVRLFEAYGIKEIEVVIQPLKE